MNVKTTVYNGSVVHLTVESVELPNGKRLDMEIIRHPGGAAVAAINEKQELCLLRQYRHAAGGWLWELPAGKLEDNEAPELTASRELAEEAGLEGESWQSLGEVITTPGICDEIVYLFLATDLHTVPTQHEASEVIEIHWLPLERAVEDVHQGKIQDAKTVIGILLAARAIK